MTGHRPATPAEAAQLAPQYAPAQVETRRYEGWIDAGYFTPDADGDGPAYTIVIPPPNVTGSLHIGHALDHTLIDALIRRRRMQGYRTLWLPGMDHAGIATQNVVERELAKEGLSRHDLGREKFVERVWQWKASSGGAILGQMRRLGDSVDWTRERFTMDEGLSRAVHTMFKLLFDEGLIYRAERIINWCPRCLTALSDIEVEHVDEDGELISIRYGSASPGGRPPATPPAGHSPGGRPPATPPAGHSPGGRPPQTPPEGDDSIVVATTRPETMLGDTAVAVHPDDPRYAHMIGRTVELPLTGRRIPVIADPHVDPEFGTGAVKVTPAHDPNDFEIGRRHDLPALTIMDERAVITAPGPFRGLDRFEARPAVLAALREEGRVVAEIRPYRHSVGHCGRCGTTVEPRLSLQWFVKVAPLAKAAGDAVRDGRVRLHPPEMAARYFDWVDDMHDWCISRQLWWGHRIPVFYGPNGAVVSPAPGEQPPTGEGWHQDPDVLDTWFSSGLWPFSTLGWPDDTPDLRAFYPTSVLVTGYDILFFWVARMMMLGLHAMASRDPADAVPFRTVALHGLVRDSRGRKMSKSRGNTVDPLDWIDRFGADALRFTLARGANPGADVAVSEEWAAGARNFCNKLWNAARFALMNGAHAPDALLDPEALSVPDRWILSRLASVTERVDAQFEEFEFGKLSELLYHFAWDEYCDWYLELAKVTLASGDEAAADRSRAVLGYVLDRLLRLLHPLIPFVTEELWTALTGEDSVVVAAWPGRQAPGAGTREPPALRDPEAEAEIASLTRLVTQVRRFRSDQGLRPGQRVAARLAGLERTPLAGHEASIRALLRLSAPADGFAPTGSVQSEGVTVELDTVGAIDVEAERRRLEKDLVAAADEMRRTQRKLANPGFTAKAPAEVIEKTRQRLAAAQAEAEALQARLEALPPA